MKFCLSACLFLILCFHKPASAQSDHLEPLPGIFAGSNFTFNYHSMIREELFIALPEIPDFRFVIVPYSGPEKVLDMTCPSYYDYCLLHYKAANENLFQSQKKQDIRRISKEISKTDSELIMKLFGTALMQTHYAETKTTGTDTTQYFITIHTTAGQ
jgi:hypothetical protein